MINDMNYNIGDLECCGNCLHYKKCKLYQYNEVCNKWTWDKKTDYIRRTLYLEEKKYE